jgi:hypothetical protein
MSIEIERATIPCGSCGAMVTELRRGRCWGCYSKWTELRPVPKGASCAVCEERRRENLRLIELHSRSVTFCHICAARTLKLVKVPSSIDGIRRLLLRDRRVGDRRALPRANASDTTHPGFTMPEFEDIEIEIQEADIEVVEQTLVRERPRL